MSFLKVIFTLFCISSFSLKAFSLVEENYANDIEAQLEMLLIQCENRKLSEDCHRFGIEIILGKVTEQITVKEESTPVIQQPEVFDSSTDHLTFSGTVNQFDFTLSVLSQLDLDQKCHQNADNLFPNKITSYELRADGQVFASLSEEDQRESTRSNLCAYFQAEAINVNLPFNHLEGKVVSGTMQGIPYYFSYSNMEDFFTACTRFWRTSVNRKVDEIFYSIHGEESGTRYRKYNSSSYWKTDGATCRVLIEEVKKYIPPSEW